MSKFESLAKQCPHIQLSKYINDENRTELTRTTETGIKYTCC